ncbi:MAG: MarR family transcriptional regulator [bacterium]|nr:MarR family transcriptional regulator [bacterium]
MDRLVGLVGYQLRRSYFHSIQLFAAATNGPDITPLQYGILETIHDSEVLAQKHVAARLGSPPQSLVPLVRDLEDRGLVERVRSEVDRRRHLLTLTEAGLDLLVEIRDRVTGVEAGLTGGLAAGEREQLLDLLCRLRRGTPV